MESLIAATPHAVAAEVPNNELQQDSETSPTK